MSVVIVKAKPELLSALSAMRTEFWQDQQAKGLREAIPACTCDDIAKLSERPRTHLLVALLDNEPTGYLFGQTKLLPGNPPIAASSMEEIFVRPAARHHGAARQLVDAALAHFQADGAKRIQLRILDANVEGTAFWRSLGFLPYVTIFERRGAS